MAAEAVAARAQQPMAHLRTIGFVGADQASWAPWASAFAERLHQLGWIEGRTINVKYRWSNGSEARVTEIASEFVRLEVDVIVANGIAVPALKQATAVIPIVFAVAVDPVGGGLVNSLARPGGNVTGLSAQGPDLASKRLEFLREIVPRLRRVAVMFHAGFPQATSEMHEVQATGRTLHLEVISLEVRRVEDIAPAFETLKADALYVVGDALTSANRTRIITFALSARLPTIFNTSDHARAGALLSYGPNFPNLFRRAAELVDKILRGTKPGDIPVEQPTKFDLVINLITAKALGLTVPPSLLARADEVIE
jgi:putative ABC transport system substrate-binding protein